MKQHTHWLRLILLLLTGFTSFLFVGCERSKEATTPECVGDTSIKLYPDEISGQKVYVDADKNIIISTEYDQIGNFNYGLAYVEFNGLYGLMDKQCNIVFDLKYDSIPLTISNPLDDDYVFLILEENGKFQLFQLDGNSLNNEEYDMINTDAIVGLMTLLVNGFDGTIPSDSFRNAFKVQKDGKWGLLSWDGEMVIPMEYDDIDIFGWAHFLEVEQNGKYGIVTTNNELVLPIVYKYISLVSGIITTDDDKMGVINKRGEIVIEAIYSSIYTVSEFEYICTLNGESITIDIEE